mgnify:FL=1
MCSKQSNSCKGRSLGQVENARRHLCIPGHQTDPVELQKLQVIEKRLSRCTDARRVGDWKNVLREAEAAIASGADSCPQVKKCLKLLSFGEVLVTGKGNWLN